VEADVLRMTTMVVDALQARTLVALRFGHDKMVYDMTTTITTIGDEAEVALLTTMDDVIMLPIEFEHGLAQTNPRITAMSGVEALSVVNGAQMKIGKGDVALVLQIASLTRSAHATVPLHLILVLPFRSSRLVPPKTVPQN
jgi:hypothetical protein